MVNEVLSDKERIAILETKMDNVEALLTTIDNKLDDLIQFKSKGLGAVGLITALVGSGIVGLVLTLWNMFQNRSHL